MNTAVIRLAGSDITDDVEVASARFQAVVNGSLGSCNFRIKDSAHTYSPIVGQRLSLDVNDSRKWSGFVAEAAEEYAFVVEDTTDGRHEVLTRFWAISGVDDNILFDKRHIWDQDDPAGHIDFQYLPGTFDDTIIKDVVNHYLNLAGDNISIEGVKRVREAILDIPGVTAMRSTTEHNSDHEGIVHTGTVASAGYTWKQMMDTIQRATGGIYFMDGVTRTDRRILRYHDVDAITSDYALTDTPDTSIELGDPDPNDPVNGDTFDRTIAPSGSGDERWGSAVVAGVPLVYDTSGWDAQMGVDGDAGTIAITAEPDFETGGFELTVPFSLEPLKFTFKTSAVPGGPIPQPNPAEDDVGWRLWIDITITAAGGDAELRVGNYAPAAYGPFEGGDPIEDGENPGITLFQSAGGSGGPVHFAKSDWLPDTEYSVKLEYDPVEGIHRIKVWETADPEPGTWTLERDSTGETANTNYEMEVGYDGFWWEVAGNDTATISIDNYDPGQTPEPPGTPIPVEQVEDPSFEQEGSGWTGGSQSAQHDEDGPFQGSNTWSGGPTLDELTVKRPVVALQAGDRILASVAVLAESSPVTVTPAIGWSLVDSYAVGNWRFALYQYVVVTPGTFVENFAFPITTPADVYASSVTSAWRGGDIVQFERNVQTTETPLGDATTPSFDALTEGQVVAVFFTNVLATQTWTTATGLTSINQVAQFFTSQSQQRRAALTTPGETVGPYTSTMSAPGSSPVYRISWLILLATDPEPHSGSYTMKLDATNGDAATEQQFVVPEGAEDLSIWYRGYCLPGSDGFEIELENISTSTTHQVLAPVCDIYGSWQEATFDLSGMIGDLVIVRMIAHSSSGESEILLDDQFGRVETSGADGGDGLGTGYTWTPWDSTFGSFGESTTYVDGSTIRMPSGTPGSPDYDSFYINDIVVPPVGSAGFDVFIPTGADLDEDQPTVGLALQHPGGFPIGAYLEAADGAGNLNLYVDWNNVDEVATLSVTPGTMVRVKFEWDATGLSRAKAWPVGDTEPGWMVEEVVEAGSWFFDSPFEALIDLFYGYNNGGDLIVDNIFVEEVLEGYTVAYYDDVNISGTYPAPLYPPTVLNRLNYEGDDPDNPIAKGYREFRITRNGRHLTNDMHVWGAALGAKLMVHSRVESAPSIAEHNRWEDGIFTVGLYRQASADAVASSWVNGTPQRKRGRKDDKVTVTCRTFMSVFKVGEVVAFANSIFGFEDALPIRSMVITFKASWIPIFDLVLSHEIDQPWSFYESLRRLPRPIEVGRWPWSFPVPEPRLPLCPVPTLAEVTGIGVTAMQSIFQRDFGGSTADEDDPPLWQNPPYGGAWFTGGGVFQRPKSLTDTVPRSMNPTPTQQQQHDVDESGYGYVNGPSSSTQAALKLRTPATGAFELLVAYRFPYNIVPGATLSVSGFLGIERLATATGLKSRSTFSGTPVALDPRLLHQPVWMRMLLIPNELGYGGVWFKIWPRDKPEPIAWSFILRDSDIPAPASGFINLGMWYDVRDLSSIAAALTPISLSIGGGGFGQFGGGFEAYAIFAEHGGSFPLHGIAWNQHVGGSASATWTYDEPAAEGSEFIFWSGHGPNYFGSSRYTAVLDVLNDDLGWPIYTIGFTWPHFDFDAWDPATELHVSFINQGIISYRLGFEFPLNPDGTTADPDDPPVGFVQKLPEMIRIKGEVFLNDESGGLYRNRGAGWVNLPFPVLLSFNWYGFGDDDPLWGTQEALPVARHYVNYDAVAFNASDPGSQFWVPFEFDIPVAAGGYEAGDKLQWGVNIVGDIEEMFRAGITLSPPGRFFLPNTATIAFEFRNLQYLSSYLTDAAGAYFCVPKMGLPVVGNVIGRPAYDSGDHLTYAVASAFVAGSTTVYVNGLMQQYGATEDYTEVPALGQIVFNAERDPDDEVIVNYEGIGPSQIP